VAYLSQNLMTPGETRGTWQRPNGAKWMRGLRGAVQYSKRGSFSCLAKHNIFNLRLQRACPPYRACNNPPFPSFFLLFFLRFSANSNSCQSLVQTPHPKNRHYRGDKDRRIKDPDPRVCICPSQRTCKWKRAHMLIK
jgi:hypothetical protein